MTGLRVIWCFLLMVMIGQLPWAVAPANAQSTNLRQPHQKAPKMVWAHYVGWGMNAVELYDDPVRLLRFYDRSLLGTHVGTDQGHGSADRIQIESAIQHGVDGFMINIIYNHAYPSVMKRYYRAAEGLPFHIALCVDGWQGSVQDAVDSMVAYLEAWGNHPNNYYIDDRPVIFVYRTNKTVEEAAEIVKGIREKGWNPYWLVQPERETTLWENEELIGQYLQIFDGLYDFGINGFSPEQIEQRLRNGRKALDKYRPDGMLAAGITRGYIGTLSGFYRPPMNTQATRENWEAALSVDADWITLTTWNDYIETTHFEPSVWARDVPLRLSREYMRKWRGEPIPSRLPEVIVSYHDEVLMGNDWVIEVLSLPYTTEPTTCHVRLLDLEGNVLRTFNPMRLPKEEIRAWNLKVSSPGMRKPRRMRIQAAIADESASSDSLEWKELFPVTVRPGIALSVRPVHMPLADIFDSARMSVSRSGNEMELTASFDSWTWLGKAELVRNDREVQQQRVVKQGGTRTQVKFTVALDDLQYPEDLYAVRFTREDGKFAWSTPVVLQGEFKTEPVRVPAIVRGADFDMAWQNRPWREPWRMPSPRITPVEVRSDDVFQMVFAMDDPDENHHLPDSGGWSVLATLGATRGGRVNEEHSPQWAHDAGPKGNSRYMLRFDGHSSQVTVTTRMLPHFSMTGEAWVRPTAVNREMHVFSDQNSGFDLGIDAQGRPFVQRRGERVVSSNTLEANTWTHIAGVYDGQKLRIFVNGRVENEIDLPNHVRSINSYPVIGARMREGQGLSSYFAGDMAGVSITARPLSERSFLLLSDHSSR